MKQMLASALLWLVFVVHASSAEYQQHQLQNQSLIITTDEGTVTITAFHEEAFEVFYQPTSVKQLPSYAVAGLPEKTQVTVKEKASALTFSTATLTAVIQKSPFNISYLKDGEMLLEEEAGLFVEDTVRGFRFILQDQEKILGGGQRVLGMDRRGHRLPLYNRAHYGYTTESNQMYFGLSAVMSSKKYALVFDNSASGFLDIGKTESDILQFEAVGGRTSYLLTVGDDYPELISNFTRLTGRQPLPPRWALGNYASRFGYHSEQETRETVQRFVDLDIPLDAVVLDLFWFGPDIKGHMGNLDWDRQAFPNPEKMIDDFQKLGVNTVLITEPFILTTSNNWQNAVENRALAVSHAGNPRTFDFYFGNTGLVDVFSQQGKDWFSGFYRKLFHQGVTGWWGDLGEPEVHPADALHNLDGVTATGDEIHNAYGHKWAEMVYQTHREMSANTRPMIMMRSGFVGSQRYGMIPWTGDVSRSWEGLKPQVELTLQMGLFGLAYTHSDLGGFAGGDTFDKEMYIRWLQYGVFQPVYRPHAQEQIAPEPVFHDKNTQDIIREYIKLRYRLLPYNYSLAYENSLTGMPLMRPMLFEGEKWLDEKDQFFWGANFLVKPVTDAGIKSVDVMLPEGVWFDFWTDKKYQGEQTIKVDTDLSHLPVLVRGGAFIPMVDPVQSTRDYHTRNLHLHYYADDAVKTASGVMYDDDGTDPDTIQNKQYEILKFNAGQNEKSLQIEIVKHGEYASAPESRSITLHIHNWPNAPSSILIDGEPITDSNWEKQNKVLKVKLNLKDKVTLNIH